MKDTSRPHPAPYSRPAPYRNRRSTDNTSPTRRTRQQYDASQLQPPGYTRETIPLSDRTQNSRRDELQTSRAVLHSPASDEHRKTGGNRAISHTERRSTHEFAREQPSHAGALSIHADVPGLSLRLPLTSTLPTINTPNRAESPLPGSVTAFLRSIELPDNPTSAPPLQIPCSPSTPPSPRLPPLSTDDTNKAACTNENSYQVSLIYKGYPFNYDLSALPDDPKGTIALLNITKSDPGAYLLIGAHYRRTGRSRAACAVIKSLLDNLDTPCGVEEGKEDAVLVPTSATSTATLVSPGSPCAKPIDCTRSVFKSTAMRPAMLLLAACELDISREHPNDPQSASHASAARELFRAVYGTINDTVVDGAIRPQPNNVLGLEFSSNRNCVSFPPSNPDEHLPNSVPPPETEFLTHVNDLERELSVACTTQKKLQEKLTLSNDRLTLAEDRVHTLEARSREVLVLLNASQDENLELRQRLADCEQRERELARCTPSAENRVWGRIKDLLFDNLGGVRGV